ncbi:hypothetical protein CPB85DRAFT_1258316 [Mucidula mucida]|nr:hypothetical protein CPB85DRAFT_1258316 [Mucidula mucida]
MDENFLDSLDTKSGVWALTHVCTCWRDIVTATSSCWTTVGLLFDKHPKSSATTDILSTYLARSNQHKLNVIVHSKDEISKLPAMKMLMKTSKQWQAGWFALPLDTFLAWETPFHFKHLNKLRVCIQPPPELPLAVLAEDSTAQCCAFSSAPGVMDVAVNNHFLFAELFDFNWSTVHLFS